MPLRSREESRSPLPKLVEDVIRRMNARFSGTRVPLALEILQGVELAVTSALRLALGCEATGCRAKWEQKFLFKLGTLIVCRGVEDAMASVKSFFSLCRLVALNPGTAWKGTPFPRPPVPLYLSRLRARQFWHQLSRGGRALPLPSDAVVEKSLKKQECILRVPYDTAAPLIADFRRFCFGIFAGCRVVFATYASPSFSACFERTRKEGGTAAAIRDLSDRFRERNTSRDQLNELSKSFPPTLFGEFRFWDCGREHLPTDGSRLDSFCFLFRKEYEIKLDEWEFVRERLFSVAASWLEIPWDVLPRGRQMAVPERGWKARVVTPVEASFGYLGSVVNSFLLKVVNGELECSSFKKGRPADHIRWKGVMRGGYVRSLDLTSATDYLPRDLMIAGLDGIRQSGIIEEPFIRVMRRSFGDFVIRKRDGSTFTTARGLLMGAPCVWPMLNLYLLWIHRRCNTSYFGAICGDDYVASVNLRRNACVNRRLSETGAIPSPGKDVLSKGSFGIFAEELISLGRRRVATTASVRLMAGVAKADFPLWLAGPRLSKEVLRCLDPDDAVRYVATRYRDVIARIAKTNIDPFGPMFAGGAGFPGAPRQSTLRDVRGLISQDRTFTLDWVGRMAGAWSVPEHWESPYGDDFKELVLPLIAEFGRSGPADAESQTVAEVVSTLVARMGFVKGLVGGEFSSRPKSLASVGRKVRDLISELRTRTFWLKGSVSFNVAGLLTWFAEIEPRVIMEIGRNPYDVTVTLSTIGTEEEELAGNLAIDGDE